MAFLSIILLLYELNPQILKDFRELSSLAGESGRGSFITAIKAVPYFLRMEGILFLRIR